MHKISNLDIMTNRSASIYYTMITNISTTLYDSTLHYNASIAYFSTR